MDLYDWLLALHLLAAFAVAAALVLFTALVVKGRRLTTLEEARTLFRLAPVGGPLIGAGTGLVLVLGVILALDSDVYHLWDPWILAAIVLWAVLGATGGLAGRYYADVRKVADSGEPGAGADVLARLRAPDGLRLQIASVVVFVLILIDMLFKPGA